jgi:alanine racemase
MPVFNISEIVKIIDGNLVGDTVNQIEYLTLDSRKIVRAKNSLFIAIVGSRHDGHQYISEMYQKGVRAFLVSKNEHIDASMGDATFIVVSDTLKALQQLAAANRAKFTKPVVAITGSNGKTIVKEWLAQSLSSKYKVIRSPKSYNSQIGVPLSVWLLDNQSEWGVFEAGISKVGEMKNLEAIISPTHGIITNIGEAHQQGFTGLIEKVEEKLKLFKHCNYIYYCRDHSLIKEQINSNSDYNNKDLISWSYTDNTATLFISQVNKSDEGTSIKLLFKDKENVFKIPFTDRASIENAIHVIAFLLTNSFSTKEVNTCLSNLQPIAMRLEQVKGVRNCTLINDAYNSDINSLEIALDYLNQLTQANKVLILSDIQQSGLLKSELYAKVSQLVSQARLTNFIGIGSDINACSEQFDATISSFFENTQSLLASTALSKLQNEFILIKGARGFQFEAIVNLLSEKKHTTVLEINLNYLTDNLNYFRSLLEPKTDMMVMVKALAYGSGNLEIAKLLEHEKVNYLGVAFTDEGVQLRREGISLPIMVMSPVVEDISRIIEYDLEPEVYSFSLLKSFIAIAKSMQISNYPIHLKIDTGMHRLGFLEDEISELLEVLHSSDAIYLKAVFSHLAASDDNSFDDFTRQQLSVFSRVYTKIEESIGYKPMRHVLNSAGIERFPEAHFEMVRLGIGLHGISSVNANLRPVSTMKTHISQIKKIPVGDTIGYGRRGKAEIQKKIAIIPIGYADGLDRKFGDGNGYVLVNGQKAFYIGSICMDMCMIDITNVNCLEGDEVIVFGDKPSISELSEFIQTIPYEILTNVSSRVKRVFLKD